MNINNLSKETIEFLKKEEMIIEWLEKILNQTLLGINDIEEK